MFLVIKHNLCDCLLPVLLSADISIPLFVILAAIPFIIGYNMLNLMLPILVAVLCSFIIVYNMFNLMLPILGAVLCSFIIGYNMANLMIANLLAVLCSFII